jgi:ribosomal protein L17
MVPLLNFDVAKIDVPAKKEIESEPKFNKNLLKTIDELELSVRSYNCLKNENIIYVGDLVTRTEAEMLKTANFGRKSLNELKENLKNMGLNFGMKLSDWPPQNLDDLLKMKNFVERIITLTKKDTLANRRLVLSLLANQQIVDRLFKNLGPRVAKRNGGYIRILKCGFRTGDKAPMAIVEMVDRVVTEVEETVEAAS